MLRRLPTSRLIALLAAIVAVLAGGATAAVTAIGGSGAEPPAKPLATALHDALTAPQVQGVTARISFTNHLIDSGSLPGGASNPLLSGATGRLWASNDGRLRLELQSDQGDAQITSDGKVVTVYEPSSNTAYRITLPRHDQAANGRGDAQDHQGPPSIADIQGFLNDVAKSADLSGATPGNVAGQPAYTVRVSPKHDGGLIGAAELAWDAAHGAPLRAAVYASGNPSPVLELKATDISFGPVDASALDAGAPANAKVNNVDLGGRDHGGGGRDKAGRDQAVTGPKDVAAQLPFALKAPDTLVGLPRHDVRLVDFHGTKGALVTYGAGLGGIAVLQEPAPAQEQGAAPKQDQRGGDHALALPKVSIGGASGEELATALGTLVRFEHGGVRYTIVGSVPPAAAEAAARAL